MPFELTWEDRGVLCRFSGIASDDDLRQANFNIYSNPKFEEIDYELIDFTDVTRLDFSSQVVRLTAGEDFRASKRNPSVRAAIVGEEKLLIGLANMYRITMDVQGATWEQGQFATVAEARAWLAGEGREER